MQREQIEYWVERDLVVVGLSEARVVVDLKCGAIFPCGQNSSLDIWQLLGVGCTSKTTPSGVVVAVVNIEVLGWNCPWKEHSGAGRASRGKLNVVH